MSAVTLHPKTLTSIELQGFDDDRMQWRCGCRPQGRKWWPCDYHQGFNDAVEAEDIEEPWITVFLVDERNEQ